MNSGLESLHLLHEQYTFVSTKSNSLHTACQHLLEEQTSLSSLSDQLSKRLIFFTEAERINTKLQSSTLAVNSEMFVGLLDRVDECYTYVLDHVSEKEYALLG